MSKNTLVSDRPTCPLPKQSDATLATALLRGLKRRCPNCGEGALFHAYLKPVDKCSACHEPLGHIRADDGPAWLTILVAGHLIVPLVLLVQPVLDWPDWLALLVWSVISLSLVLLLLPRSKGVFIAAIWKTKGPGSERS